MADSTTPTPVPPATPADRDAAIEQLLLTGLDHYFAGRFDQAVHLWTRILFLDRGHARARAYIERARLAMAEGQRALEERQSQESASGPARRVPIAWPALPAADVTKEGVSPASRATDGAERTARRTEPVWPHVTLTVVSLVLLAAAAYIASEGDTLSRWMLSTPSDVSAVDAVDEATPLPIPDTSQMLVERARALFVRGHVREALDVLDGVRANDVAKPESDTLRGELQRTLLDAGGFPSSPAPSPATAR